MGKAYNKFHYFGVKSKVLLFDCLMSLVKYLWFQRKDLTGNVNSSQTTVLCTIDLPVDKHLSRCIYYHLILKRSS